MANVRRLKKEIEFMSSQLIGDCVDFLDTFEDKKEVSVLSIIEQAVLLNNIDHDHHDFYPTLESYISAFTDFMQKIPKKGFLVANFDDPEIQKTAQVNCKGKVITYAIDEAADYVAYDIKAHAGKQYFKVKLGVEDEDDDIKSPSPPLLKGVKTAEVKTTEFKPAKSLYIFC